MIKKTGNVLTKELHLPDEAGVIQSIRDGLTLSQHAPLSSLTINGGLMVLVDAASPAIDKFRPGYTLDPTTKMEITKEVLGSVRTNVSITVANEIAPPSARIKGGYTVHARGPGGQTS